MGSSRALVVAEKRRMFCCAPLVVSSSSTRHPIYQTGFHRSEVRYRVIRCVLIPVQGMCHGTETLICGPTVLRGTGILAPATFNIPYLTVHQCTAVGSMRVERPSFVPPVP